MFLLLHSTKITLDLAPHCCVQCTAAVSRKLLRSLAVGAQCPQGAIEPVTPPLCLSTYLHKSNTCRRILCHGTSGPQVPSNVISAVTCREEKKQTCSSSSLAGTLTWMFSWKSATSSTGILTRCVLSAMPSSMLLALLLRSSKAYHFLQNSSVMALGGSMVCGVFTMCCKHGHDAAKVQGTRPLSCCSCSLF